MYTSPSGKKYVGQTWGFENRSAEHRRARGRCPAFHSAIKKYGYESMLITILHTGIDTQKDMDELEIFEISKNSTVYPNGYNVRYGGSGGRLNDEDRKKMSIKTALRYKSKDAREVTSKSQIERYRDNNERIKSSESAKKRYSNPEYRERHADMIRKTHSKKVLCVSTGMVYESLTHASKESGARVSHISSCCHKKRPVAGGFRWDFA